MQYSRPGLTRAWRAVWRNPTNGTESLYIASHAYAVEGMSAVEGQNLIAELTAWATQDEYVYCHQWRQGDVLVWDERATMHRGCAWPYEQERTLASICVSAGYRDGLGTVSPAKPAFSGLRKLFPECAMRKYLLFLVLICSVNVNGTELIAHRGITPGFQENTLAAIEESWKLGADAVEIDLRLSVDGIVYLFHDDEIDAGYVNEFEYAQLNATLFDTEIPTLASVFNLGFPSGFYILDLKDHHEQMKNALVEVIKQTRFPANKLVVQSHDVDLLVSIREAIPSAKYSFLTGLKRNIGVINNNNPADIANSLKQYDIDHIAAKGRSFIDHRFVDEFRKRGICFFVWTINDISRIKYYSAIGVDGVITDVLATLKRMN